MEHTGLFIAALVTVYLLPGPDMLLILQTASTQGCRAALAVAAGLALARCIHVTLAGFGLAALLHSSPQTFEVLRLAGAAYLIWLGLHIARSPLPDAQEPAREPPMPAHSLAAATLRGLLTNLTNPKALLFCSMLLPQFVSVDVTDPAGPFFRPGAVLVGIGLLFDVLYVFAGVAIGHWLRRSVLRRRMQQWGFGALLVAFGARLALTGRTD